MWICHILCDRQWKTNILSHYFLICKIVTLRYMSPPLLFKTKLLRTVLKKGRWSLMSNFITGVQLRFFSVCISHVFTYLLQFWFAFIFTVSTRVVLADEPSPKWLFWLYKYFYHAFKWKYWPSSSVLVLVYFNQVYSSTREVIFIHSKTRKPVHSLKDKLLYWASVDLKNKR